MASDNGGEHSSQGCPARDERTPLTRWADNACVLPTCKARAAWLASKEYRLRKFIDQVRRSDWPI